jgi:hypothetical protein
VTVLAGVGTGLAEPDVFYFGNLVGETGNSAHSLAVTSLDELKTRNALYTTAATTESRYDFNRDGRVNSLDLLIVRQNKGKTLPLLAAPAAGGGPSRGGTSRTFAFSTTAVVLRTTEQEREGAPALLG